MTRDLVCADCDAVTGVVATSRDTTPAEIVARAHELAPGVPDGRAGLIVWVSAAAARWLADRMAGDPVLPDSWCNLAEVPFWWGAPRARRSVIWACDCTRSTPVDRLAELEPA